MKGEILRSERLIFRELNDDDFDDLYAILGDEQTMYAYEHAFDVNEAREWLLRQRQRYLNDGFGLWAALSGGRFVGNMGITLQQWGDRTVPEIGYLLKRNEWHRGYAAEGAAALKRYAFDVLGFSEIFSIIRPSNLPSVKVAQRNGMVKVGGFDKFYYGLVMPHDVYRASKNS